MPQRFVGVPQEPGLGAPRGPSSGPAPAGNPFADTDFGIQCWPATAVLPGRSTSVECLVLLTGGYNSEIALNCRVDGMNCGMSPDRIRPLPGRSTMTTRLTVTAPADAEVGTQWASVTATGGEAGATPEQALVNVNVPPPFTVSCESIGTLFVKGEKAEVKCWVTFLDGSSDVTLGIRNGAGLPAGLDTTTLTGAPNETRAFSVELDTENLPTRDYVLTVSASSNRYQQEATAVFQVVPPA